MHLLIDNYDSFTFNIVQALGSLGAEIKVFRNDEITVADALEMQPDSLIISPGPGTPKDAGVSSDLIRAFADSIPILGVCLGHQCIAEVYGATISRAERLMHGKVSMVYHDGRSIYTSLTNPFQATRYHSLIALEPTIPPELEISAYTSEGEIMGIRLKGRPVEGVQFHPESILTPEGIQLFRNFLQTTQAKRRAS